MMRAKSYRNRISLLIVILIESSRINIGTNFHLSVPLERLFCKIHNFQHYVNCKIGLLMLAKIFSSKRVNPFFPNALFLYPLRFSVVFRGYRKGTLGMNGLKSCFDNEQQVYENPCQSQMGIVHFARAWNSPKN